MVRGPLIGTVTSRVAANVIGTQAGSLLGVSRARGRGGRPRPVPQAGSDQHRADRRARSLSVSGSTRPKIVSLDPFGARRQSPRFSSYFEKGYDIRPTIAITRAHIHVPELASAVQAGRVKVDGKIVREGGAIEVVKAAIEPVWYLPGVAARFGCTEANLRRTLFEHTGGHVPRARDARRSRGIPAPIGGATIYMFGDIASIPDRSKPLAVRVHDECNGSDVFGSDICTCRPYLTHGIEECIRDGARGRVGGHRLQPQGGARARRGDQVPRLQRSQAARRRGPRRRSTSRAPSASPGCRTCAFKSSCPTCSTGSGSPRSTASSR